MITLPAHDRRVAEMLADLASGLDAGLPLGRILVGGTLRRLRGPTDSGDGVVASAERRGVPLTSSERPILAAAEAAGRLPAALRRASARRQRRAERTAGILARFAYPAFLLVFALGVFTLVGIGASAIWWSLLGAAITAAVLALWIRQQVRDPSARGRSLPLIGPLLRDLGEVPYLETLLGAYGAGIPIADAHAQATVAAPIASVRARLFAAGKTMTAAGQPLAEALLAHDAVDVETLDILALAEQAGDLEHGLERALGRREDQLGRKLDRTARVVSGVVYAAVVLLVVSQIFRFYSTMGRALG